MDDWEEHMKQFVADDIISFTIPANKNEVT